MSIFLSLSYNFISKSVFWYFRYIIQKILNNAQDNEANYLNLKSVNSRLGILDVQNIKHIVDTSINLKLITVIVTERNASALPLSSHR